jgi:hypothetical protein
VTTASFALRATAAGINSGGGAEGPRGRGDFGGIRDARYTRPGLACADHHRYPSLGCTAGIHLDLSGTGSAMPTMPVDCSPDAATVTGGGGGGPTGRSGNRLDRLGWR